MVGKIGLVICKFNNIIHPCFHIKHFTNYYYCWQPFKSIRNRKKNLVYHILHFHFWILLLLEKGTK